MGIFEEWSGLCNSYSREIQPHTTTTTTVYYSQVTVNVKFRITYGIWIISPKFSTIFLGFVWLIIDTFPNVCIFIDCNAGYKEYTQILVLLNKYTDNKRRLNKLIMVGYLFIPIYKRKVSK